MGWRLGRQKRGQFCRPLTAAKFYRYPAVPCNPEDGKVNPITQPLRAFAREQKISPTQVYRWADEGEIETVLIGARRHIVVESYKRMIKRWRVEQGNAKLPSSNPKEGAAGTPARTGDTSAR
jgi:hypothetical protein